MLWVSGKFVIEDEYLSILLYFTLLGFVNPFLVSSTAMTVEKYNGRIEAIVVEAQLPMSHFSRH